jgi:hypothetical protein
LKTRKFSPKKKKNPPFSKNFFFLDGTTFPYDRCMLFSEMFMTSAALCALLRNRDLKTQKFSSKKKRYPHTFGECPEICSGSLLVDGYVGAIRFTQLLGHGFKRCLLLPLLRLRLRLLLLLLSPSRNLFCPRWVFYRMCLTGRSVLSICRFLNLLCCTGPSLL